MAVQADPQTLFIGFMLVALFIVAYKVFKMLLQTALVTMISASFYIALSFVFDLPMSFKNVITYGFTGATLYMVFNLTSSVFTGVSKAGTSLASFMGSIYNLLSSGSSDARKKVRNLEKKVSSLEKKVRKNQDDEAQEENNSSVKEVVLDNEN